MTTLHFLRHAPASDLRIDRTRHSHRFSLDFDDLESRELLSTILPAATTSDPGITPSTNTPGPVATASSTETTLGNVATPGTSSSVVTNSDGDIGSTQAQLTLNSVPSNLASATVSVVQTPSGLSVADSFPITALLPPSVTENETPVDNGTDISGTVWITPPPVSPGVFHTPITASPVFTNQFNQTVNPQGGPPSFTHIGQNSNGALNGATTQQPVAVGPVGPSITEEVQPVQPPPAASQQPVGVPVQSQQDQTAPTQAQDSPSGSAPGATQPQGTTPTQPSATQPATSQPATSQPAAPTTGAPSQESGNAPAQPAASPAPNTGSAGSSSGSAYHFAPQLDQNSLGHDQALDLIDASITSLASSPPAPDVLHLPQDTRLSALVGATAVAATTYQLTLQNARSQNRRVGARKPQEPAQA